MVLIDVIRPEPPIEAVDVFAPANDLSNEPLNGIQCDVVTEFFDRCDDLYGVAKGQPEQILSRVTQTPAEIPQDIAIELSKLDPGEVSTALTGSDGRSLRFLMLCSRTAVGNQEADREQVLNALRQRRLQGYSDQLLEQLRADARISRQ